jgi:hypothetical protein
MMVVVVGVYKEGENMEDKEAGKKHENCWR